MRTFKVSELVFDFGFYPRMQVDAQHTAYIADAMAAGYEFPPIIVDKASRRIVDGFHRARGAQKLHGKDATITGIEKHYKDDREMFLDAMRYNSSHGRTLTVYDRAHCALLGADLEIDDEALAGALHVSTQSIGELRTNRFAKSDSKLIPIKRTIAHFAGRRLTKGQVEANRKLSGMEQTFYANQLILLIENDLLETANENLMERLAVLAMLLRKVAKKVA